MISGNELIPGLRSAERGDGLKVTRVAPNMWWAALGPWPSELRLTATQQSPSSVLSAREGVQRPVTLAKVELDTCGAWITLCNAEPARPIVVRKAGWVDVRGHPVAEDDELRDDRIGLGPGDALVLMRVVDDSGEPDERVLDSLLADAGQEASVIVATAHALSNDATAAVIAVPADLGDDPRARVVVALGVEDADLVLPGYPLGDLQPEIWRDPPRPPWVARMRLTPDASSVKSVRALLDRLLASWRLDGRVDEAGLKLAASELATNALLHGDEPETATIRYLGKTLRIEVDDRSAVIPVPVESDHDTPGGRGLKLVEAVSADWGVTPRPVGKRVWCEVAVSS